MKKYFFLIRLLSDCVNPAGFLLKFWLNNT